MNVAFINHTQKQCGVYQYGKRVSDILKTDDRYSLEYIECDSYGEFSSQINDKHFSHIIYNWHPSTMSWLNIEITNSFKDNSKQLIVYHETSLPTHLSVDGLIMTDLSENKELKRFSLPRPIYEIDLPNVKNEKIKIGSFGFGFNNKGFERICDVINKNFDNAIIHLHITNAFFGDKNKTISNGVIDRCKSLMNGKTNELIITTDFLDNQDILNFLNENDVNIFLYDNMPGRGLSSVIDYAVSVNTPLIVNNSNMFRHLLSDRPSISIDNDDIKSIIGRGKKDLVYFRDKWSNLNLKNKFLEILNEI